MIGWLSDWLRDIIAVILLAVLVELLLPNKSMQRYARLVIGLFILLTILSPILRLLQTDMTSRLDAGMELWNERSISKQVKMPSLEEIQRRADDIQTKRHEEAARLTAATLEEAMGQAITSETGAMVERVIVTLAWNDRQKQNEAPEIAAVKVTLKGSAGSENSESGKGQKQIEIEAVAPVDITVGDNAKGNNADPAEKNGYISPNKKEMTAVQNVLSRGWGVRAEKVDVRVRSSGGSTAKSYK
ncbi:stage III sporulation protein AF [Paenibacillus sp. 1011MAR3C5]|uniref:stage III sporulation protein AF n=1 Tax=Paenibacillus sp. 1011MAR3C5 TaxID=1675787 RepID=UPI000E6B99B2|nr:stage III sporulation protein AF [Paenibacillus sp. 1011MAR3C5]RJE89943.1 stage III sporulation protein AF [Paenibacillus sp. 1011MAR3C5]